MRESKYQLTDFHCFLIRDSLLGVKKLFAPRPQTKFWYCFRGSFQNFQRPHPSVLYGIPQFTVFGIEAENLADN